MPRTRIALLILASMTLVIGPALSATETGRNFVNRNDQIICGHDDEMDRFLRGESRARPNLSGTEIYISSTNFRVWYTTTGYDSVPVAYADSVSKYAEFCWTRISTLGWALPPPDGTNGGDSKYDIYIRNCDTLDYTGVCVEESPYTTPYPDGYTSWVEVNGHCATYLRLTALVAHEFHHSSQKRYSQFENDPERFIYENTSVYMEDICYDNVNTLYGRLHENPGHITTPHWPITVRQDRFQYTGGLFATFLDEYYNPTVCQPLIQMWTLFGNHSGEHTRVDIDSILRINYNSSFQKAVGHYAIWRYFMDSLDDGMHFIEGASYDTTVPTRTWSAYPVSGNEGFWNPSGPGGCNYNRLLNYGSTNDLTIYFNGQNGYEWAVYLLAYNGTTSYEYKMVLDATQDTGTIIIPGSVFPTKVVLIPVVVQWNPLCTNLVYDFTASTSPSIIGVDEPRAGVPEIPKFEISPNPVCDNAVITYAITADGTPTISIFDAAGRIVNIVRSPSNPFRWDRSDAFGNRLPAGVYFIRLEGRDVAVTKKIVLR
jgi:hypothetical protein